jgi:hypothetical protein
MYDERTAWKEDRDLDAFNEALVALFAEER